MRVSPLPNKLNEIKERSNIIFDSVVTSKLFHESLMLTFNEFLTSDPVYGTNVKFLCPIDTTSTLLIMLKVLRNLLKIKVAKPFLYGEHETPMNCKAVHSNVFVPPYRFFYIELELGTVKSNVGKFVRATTRTIPRAIRCNSVACRNITNKVSDYAIGISPFDKAFNLLGSIKYLPREELLDLLIAPIN
ncbi:hypothetical protein PIROE2DRAFT_12282 [Piromyces sp. E2]|nr:hypothetical protein PIROE2DRAFT_12282 [Piromyces sp. E2]|eukprot:OUM61641.1 hypothetical protein PIROE2DRAFT_12282 [Piromyces sp. E2]